VVLNCSLLAFTLPLTPTVAAEVPNRAVSTPVESVQATSALVESDQLAVPSPVQVPVPP